jgi:predicted RecA/RadA family phage recombinase
MPECNYLNEGEIVQATLTAAVSAGQVVQLEDGRAAFAPRAVDAGVQGSYQVSGVCEVAKTTTMVMLVGSQLFWDHSANKAHLKHVNDKDFPLGVAVDDAASAATTVKVKLNEKPYYTATLGDGFATAPISTAGWPVVHGTARGCNLAFDTATEAQKVDALSLRGFAPAAPAIVEALICINLNADNAAADLNIGLANATHATEADDITESLFIHMDGNSLDILAESDDGTTEVAATDTTVNAVVGTPFLVQWDLRNNADIQLYIDGVNVLPNSVFKLNAATGPLKLLAHWEKSSDNSPGNVSVALLGYRTFDAMTTN